MGRVGGGCSGFERAWNRKTEEFRVQVDGDQQDLDDAERDAASSGPGIRLQGQTVFDTAFGGKEVVVIMERDRDAKPERHEYKLLATSKTSTMQKELIDAGEAGFEFVGMTVAETAFGGKELVTILRRSPGK